jgi:hypothetical protein
MWNECTRYADQSDGQAPPLKWITHKYRSFVFTPGISLRYAVQKVKAAALNRDMRERLVMAHQALAVEDEETAYNLFQGAEPPASATKDPVSWADPNNWVPLSHDLIVELPWPTLQKATGGIKPGELFFLAAYLKEGKSYYGAKAVVQAAKTGVHCAINSMEMSARAMGIRVAELLAEGNVEYLRVLRGDDVTAKQELVAHLLEILPGSIDIFDRTIGNVESVLFVRDLAATGRYGFIFVDHINLMCDAKGRPGEEDHSILAQISHSLQKTAQSNQVPMLITCQLNRASQERGGSRAPGSEFVGGSISIARDADCLVTFRRRSDRVAVMSNTAYRDGPARSWFSRFDVVRNEFGEIDKSLADQLIAADEDRKTYLD